MLAKASKANKMACVETHPSTSLQLEIVKLAKLTNLGLKVCVKLMEKT